VITAIGRLHAPGASSRRALANRNAAEHINTLGMVARTTRAFSETGPCARLASADRIRHPRLRSPRRGAEIAAAARETHRKPGEALPAPWRASGSRSGNELRAGRGRCRPAHLRRPNGRRGQSRPNALRNSDFARSSTRSLLLGSFLPARLM